MSIGFSNFITKDRALEVFQTLQKGPKYVRETIRIIGGSNNTILMRINELIDMRYAIDHFEGNKRIIQLTDSGFDIARKLEYFVEPGSPSERERWIPALLWGIGTDRKSKHVWGKIRLQKLLFLLQNDEKFLVKQVPYIFYPFKQGPFDYNIFEDVRNLEEKLLIRIKKIQANNIKESEMYELTQKGADVARKVYYSFPEHIRRKLVQLRKFNSMPFKHLMSYVYSNFPEYKSKADPEFVKSMGLDN